MSDKKKQEKTEKNIKDAEEVVETITASEEEEQFLEGKSVDEIIEEDIIEKKTKNYISLIILLIGMLVGSLFVDTLQFLNKKGYSVRALKDANIFSLDGKTWVAYEEPIVKLNILTTSGEDLKDCPTCVIPEEVTDLLKKVMPTLVINQVDVNSEEGKKLVKKDKIKSLPALIFSKELEKTNFYNGEAREIFNKIDDKDGYSLNITALGLPVGKYIETPSADDEDPVIGNKDANVKIILFSDYQCPYCARFFNEIVTVAKSFGDKVVLIYKDFPLDFHKESKNAAMAGECAKDQDKFWEMSDLLYKTQGQWGKMNDEQANDFFKKQAVKLRLNPEDFNECLDSKKHQDKIDKILSEAKEFGISGTPSLFINDKYFSGALPEKQLREAIQAEIDKANGTDKKEDEKTDEKKDETVVLPTVKENK